jgi:23S rRNA (adenine2503-C2)-methyltransferase
MDRPQPTSRKANLYDLAPDAVASALAPFVSPSFRVRQIQEWIYARGVDSFESMSNLSKETRADLSGRFSLAFPVAKERTEPAPDGSVKYLFTLEDGALIEAVYMPMGTRTTLCLSSQAGCAVGCTFCVTGFFGAGRNLTPAEIVGQMHRVRHEQGIANEAINVVFMGMGEPMLNFEQVATSLEIMEQSISLRRVTISTAGIIPGIDELAALERRPNLAVSINAPDRERREEIMPITKKYPLEELMASLRRFPLETGRDITAEYVLLAGWNDSTADAAMLAKLLRGGRFKVNAIPFNPDPALPEWMKRPTDSAIDRFAAALTRQGVPVTVRRSKGNEIAAACGQLRGKTERRRSATKPS